ncbi:MAG: response regulator, partial [Alphaproteobacteria bacterium]|nr:response regulator [Alphaproteobacteria bacterium]
LAAEAPSTAALPTDDNGNVIGPGDAFLLIVEEDADFRKTLCELSRRKDVRCVAVGDGEAALDMVRRRSPAGIILDTDLPAMGGWTLLERLKSDPDTRRIPVHFVSASNESSRSPDGEGASGDRIEGVLARIAHAAANKGRRLLIVDDDPGACAAITSLVGSKDVTVTSVGSGEDALDLLRRTSFDCVILDLGLPGMSGFDFLERAAGDADVTLPPVVVHSGRDLTREESMRLREYTDSIVIKGTQSPERLLDEVTLFLHSIHSRLPERQRRLLEQAREHDEALAGKTVLVVDDDMRNAFALSRALRPKGLEVRLAQDGRKALSILDEAGADIVLMDIMMPGMDGYETTRAIRSRHEFAALPVIAITAKAMPGDRQKCIEAGASDYLTKPVDMERLLSMMAVWLHQE